MLQYYAKSWSVILRAVATAMEHHDPYILAAMDGVDFHPESNKSSVANRSEPTVFFFVVFGLVYEALSTSSADSASTSSTRQSLVISALQALKCLVRPEYSGKAILEPTIFDEFISLCYRMAMTESANIQVYLIEVLSTLAASQSQDSPADVLSLTSPTAHCLRICAHLLRHSTSATHGPIIRQSSCLTLGATTDVHLRG